MAPKGGDRAVYDEDERRKFLLGFHNRKQERKIEHLTKKALRAKQERVLEKFAKKRNLLKREKELGLMDTDYGMSKKVRTQQDVEDSFSKNMFGTEEVTVTVEYDGDNDEDLLNQENDVEEMHSEENRVEEEEEDEDELNEEEEKILENVKLTENELRKIREEAGKKKHKKGKRKHRKGRR